MNKKIRKQEEDRYPYYYNDDQLILHLKAELVNYKLLLEKYKRFTKNNPIYDTLHQQISTLLKEKESLVQQVHALNTALEETTKKLGSKHTSLKNINALLKRSMQKKENELRKAMERSELVERKVSTLEQTTTTLNQQLTEATGQVEKILNEKKVAIERLQEKQTEMNRLAQNYKKRTNHYKNVIIKLKESEANLLEVKHENHKKIQELSEQLKHANQASDENLKKMKEALTKQQDYKQKLISKEDEANQTIENFTARLQEATRHHESSLKEEEKLKEEIKVYKLKLQNLEMSKQEVIEFYEKQLNEMKNKQLLQYLDTIRQEIIEELNKQHVTINHMYSEAKDEQIEFKNTVSNNFDELITTESHLTDKIEGLEERISKAITEIDRENIVKKFTNPQIERLLSSHLEYLQYKSRAIPYDSGRKK